MTYIFHKTEMIIKEKATVKHPNSYCHNEKYSYNAAMAEYNNHIASLRSYPCHPSCADVWEDGKEIPEKDFEIREHCAISPCMCKDVENCQHPIYKVHPLHKQESEDELWKQVLTTIGAAVELFEPEIKKLKQSFTIKRKP